MAGSRHEATDVCPCRTAPWSAPAAPDGPSWDTGGARSRPVGRACEASAGVACSPTSGRAAMTDQPPQPEWVQDPDGNWHQLDPAIRAKAEEEAAAAAKTAANGKGM